MSSKKSHREKLARQAAADAAPEAPEATTAKQKWPIERFDMEALGPIENEGARGYCMGRVFQNENGSVYAVFPEGTKLVGAAEIMYEAAPAQDATEEPDTRSGSRYKRSRRWWEQGKWERTR